MTNEKDLIADRIKAELVVRKHESMLPHIHGFPPYQWTLDYWESTARLKFLTAANQVSKAEPVSNLIPTPNGFVPMGDLKVGDEVFTESGESTRVIDIPFEGMSDCFEVTFDDGDSIVVSDNHLWKCMGPDQRFRKSYTSNRGVSTGKVVTNPEYRSYGVKSTKDIFEHCYNKEHPIVASRRYAIPMCSAVLYPKADLPINSYLLGVMLGDGCLGHSGKTIALNAQDTPIADLFLQNGATPRTHSSENVVCFGVGFASKAIDDLKLNVGSCDKFLPGEYLLSSLRQRVELLAGLMDTDGTVDESGQRCSYSTSSQELARGVKELVNSLGGMAEIKKRKAGYKKNGVFVKCKDSYQVSVWLQYNPFKLSTRKLERWAAPRRYSHQRVIYSIKPVSKTKTRCISVSDKSKTYLSSKNYIVTHNSSTQIRHAIDLATDETKWRPEAGYFPHRPPKTFIYVYPDQKKVKSEFDEKWETEFLPQGSMKDDPVYGWRLSKDRGDYDKLVFNSGVSIYFKGWKADLQAATVDAVFIDEEPPVALWPELQARTTRYDGFISCVFTATLNQQFFYEVMERRGQPNERFKDAFKRQISMEYDCRYYADGSESPWTVDKVKSAKAKCGSETEIQRRIHGRFVSEDGLLISAFNDANHIKPATPVPKNWLYYAGVDIGSGGKQHPAAIAITAVRPDFKEGRVVKLWKGNSQERTDSEDILKQYVKMVHGINVTGAFYDWQAIEFGLRAEKAMIPFERAKKTQKGSSGDITGYDLFNILLKNNMLTIDDSKDECPVEQVSYVSSLVTEFKTCRLGTKKKDAKDDAIDAVRFSITSVPWDLNSITGDDIIEAVLTEVEKPLKTRHEPIEEEWKQNEYSVESDFDFYNDLMEG